MILLSQSIQISDFLNMLLVYSYRLQKAQLKVGEQALFLR